MINHSDQINEIATALSKCQGENDRFSEGELLKKVINRKFKGCNGSHKKSLEYRFYEKIAFGSTECWHWIGTIDSVGYGRLMHPKENKAHRISWIIHVGQIPKGMKILHRCDLRSCVNPDHLFLGSQSDNVKDMMNKKRNVAKGLNGELNPMAKLTSEDVEKMKNIRKSTAMSFNKIAKIMGISTMTVYRACTGKSWRKNENI